MNQEKLIFGLYNISSRRYPIISGKKLVAGIFYKLDDTEIEEASVKPEPLYDFPDDLLALVKGYKPVSNRMVENFTDKINVLKEEIKNLKQQLDEDKKWSDDFKRGLSENNAQIKEIGVQIGTK